MNVVLRGDVKHLRQAAEAILWSVGAVALTYAGWTWGDAAYEQIRGNRLFDQQVATAKNVVPSPVQEGSLIGRLEVPRLGISTIVFEGTSEATLAKGVGHVIGTALPARTGNVVLAAHRDTFFRPLKNVRKGDLITFKTLRAEVRYEVVEAEVVLPGAVEVMQPTNPPVLTLITCYPFSYLGSAPDRFVVRAVALE